jgi:streptogramin lyase
MRPMSPLIAWALALTAASAVLGVASASSAAPGKVVIKTRGNPLGMTVGFGSVWAFDHRDGFVYRINRRSRHVRAINVGVALCGAVAAGAGAVWVGGCNGEGGTLSYQISPRTNRVVAQRRGVNPVFGAGSLWTNSADGRYVLRIDPKSGVVLARIRPGIDISQVGLAGFGAGSVWAASDTEVSRIDASTNKVVAIVPLPGAKASGEYAGGYLYGGFAAFAGGKAWLTNPAGVYELDPQTNTAKLLRVRIRPMSAVGDIMIAANAKGVWVRTGNITVARIDPSTASVVHTYPAARAGGGGGITLGFGSLWVANFNVGTIWREAIH